MIIWNDLHYQKTIFTSPEDNENIIDINLVIDIAPCQISLLYEDK